MDEDSPWGDQPSTSSASQSIKNGHESATPIATDSKPAVDNPPSDPNSTPTPTPRKGPSKGRTTRRFGTQSTTLEALDDSLGPLGPLGVEHAPLTSDDRPAVVQKDSSPSQNHPPPPKSPGRVMTDFAHLDDDLRRDIRARDPPPVGPSPVTDGPRRSTPAHVSIEQAAKPSFDITVGDPHKVGDLTGSHTVYQVRTQTSSKAYRTPEFSVTRRYRDFLWLYNQLHNNNPGIVVPPPPEKQAVGRFDLNFVESRRAALERMLNKVAAHPVLQHDGDLKLFLESEAFNVDIKHKERKDIGLPEAKTGVLGTIGINVGSTTKFVEHDDWFHDRRIYMDALENQLKALLKSTDMVVAQRKALAEDAASFADSLSRLAGVELSPALFEPLNGLSDVQFRIRELCKRQAMQDELTLGIVIDEYIRLIGSVKTAFGQRQRAFHTWHAAESALVKIRLAHEKLLRSGRSQQDRINQTQADVADAERRVNQARLLFEDMGRLMRAELERFEREKVEDFKSGVETFLESAVEAQKELIEIWETYLLQFDAATDDGSAVDDAEGVIARSQSQSHSSQQAQSQSLQASQSQAKQATDVQREVNASHETRSDTGIDEPDAQSSVDRLTDAVAATNVHDTT